MSSANRACTKCGWSHGKKGHPAECPPECGACGWRHGARDDFKKKRGIGKTCKTKEASSDAHTTRETINDYAYFQGNCPLPDGARDGKATGDGNNCLIHSLIQLVTPMQLLPSRQEQIQWCRNIRANMAEKRGCTRGDFLDVAGWWAAILDELAKNVNMYTIRVYTEGGAGEQHGAGPNVLRLRNKGFNHFAPARIAEWARNANSRSPAPASPQPCAATSSPRRTGPPSLREGENQPRHQ